ncbi:hypothetical protein F53441_11134 [Fusarium austroafricanum]|uniref:Uncharacterized protein n=1 Tax=Fusarium austroafricanum TaxID=2364996 RepID=A0A8H4K6W9_9HYPO|nr:hypothetical protein F53441_11134 [Fusarium austroafricanum]
MADEEVSSIIDQYMNGAGLQNQSLAKYLDSLRGDTDLPDDPDSGDDDDNNGELPDINLGGNGGNAGQLPDINIGGGDDKSNHADLPKPPPKVVKALTKLNRAITKVDNTVAEVGGGVFQTDNWWPHVRQLIVDRRFEHAKLSIKEFLSTLDDVKSDQEKLINSLEKLERKLYPFYPPPHHKHHLFVSPNQLLFSFHQNVEFEYLEGIAGLFKDAPEETGEVDGEIVDGDKPVTTASEEIDKLQIDGLDNADKAVEGGGTIDQQVQEGMQESQKEMSKVTKELEDGDPDAPEKAKELEKKWSKMFKNVWASAKTFGKFVGVELAKGALFTAGMVLLQDVLAKLAAQQQQAQAGSTTATPAQPDPRVQAIQAINQAGKILHDAIKTWTKWQAAHFSDRDSFGTITVENFPISIFQILQSDISTLGDQRDKMLPLVITIKKTQALSDIQALLTADIAYAQAVLSLSNQISSNMTALTAAGLPSKTTEIQNAVNILTAVTIPSS